MIAPRCPQTGRRALVWYDEMALVNLAPGRILVRWRCPCGAEHEALAGSTPGVDPPFIS